LRIGIRDDDWAVACLFGGGGEMDSDGGFSGTTLLIRDN